METNMATDMKHTRTHLRRAMNRERLSGEYFLAAVIQDSLLYNLAHHADSRALMDIAHDASGFAVQSAAEMMDSNQFAVSESVRGVMHSMVSLGGEPVQMAIAIYIGGWTGLDTVSQGNVDDSLNAIASGILSAEEDLGIFTDGRRTVTDYLIAHTAIPISQSEPCAEANAVPAKSLT
jgi:hypothetical protein